MPNEFSSIATNEITIIGHTFKLVLIAIGRLAIIITLRVIFGIFFSLQALGLFRIIISLMFRFGKVF